MTTGVEELGADDTLTELRSSHERLVTLLSGLSDEQVAGPSYADEWSIAQVASHLGSGAEIFRRFLDAGLRRADGPGPDDFQPIWARWDAKAAPEQARDAVTSDAKFLEAVEALTADERASWHLDLFGNPTDLAGMLRMRLGEHALHSWDIAVALDPDATLPSASAEIILGSLPGLAGLAGKPMPNPRGVRIVAADRNFVLEPTDDGVRLGPEPAEPVELSASLRLPAEAFVRLVYGRLDADHTPTSVAAEGIELDDLRRTFPGI